MKRAGRRKGNAGDSLILLNQQLNWYGRAAAAAGVSALALARASEAKIIYTPTHHFIGDGHSYRLDLTGGGTADLTFQNRLVRRCGTYGTCWSNESLVGRMAKGNEVVHNYFGAVAMKPGMGIGPKCTFSGGRQLMASIYSGPYPRGSWINVKDRYLGVKFKINGERTTGGQD